MKGSSYAHRECLEDAHGTKFFFGRYGYIEIQDDVAVAHITAPAAFLRDSKFSDEQARTYCEPQELIVSMAGLGGMLRHLEVSAYSQDQRRSAIYKRFNAKITGRQNLVIIEELTTHLQATRTTP